MMVESWHFMLSRESWLPLLVASYPDTRHRGAFVRFVNHVLVHCDVCFWQVSGNKLLSSGTDKYLLLWLAEDEKEDELIPTYCWSVYLSILVVFQSVIWRIHVHVHMPLSWCTFTMNERVSTTAPELKSLLTAIQSVVFVLFTCSLTREALS